MRCSKVSVTSVMTFCRHFGPLYVSADDICILQKKMHDMSLHPYLSALYKDETKQEETVKSLFFFDS